MAKKKNTPRKLTQFQYDILMQNIKAMQNGEKIYSAIPKKLIEKFKNDPRVSPEMRMIISNQKMMGFILGNVLKQFAPGAEVTVETKKRNE